MGLFDRNKKEIEEEEIVRIPDVFVKEFIEEQKHKKLVRAAVEVGKEYPEFDLEAELKNDTFRKLVDQEIDMKKIYEYIHRDELFEQLPCNGNKNINPALKLEWCEFLCESEGVVKPAPFNASKMTLYEIFREAHARGVTIGQVKELRQQENEVAEKKYYYNKSKFLSLAHEATKVLAKFDSFDLKREWSKPQFKTIAMSLGVMAAYEFTNFDSLFRRVNRVEKRIETGNCNEVESHDDVEKNDAAESHDEVHMCDAVEMHAKIETQAGVLADVQDKIETLCCRICEKKIPTDSVFCPYCGTKVVKY